MFNFDKEVAIANSVADVFAQLEERLAGRDSYGISDWYKDLAWGVRFLVEVEAPLFTGKNEETWLTLADEYSKRADHYVGKAAFTASWEGAKAETTWPAAFANVGNALGFWTSIFAASALEDADVSGLLPSGGKGINLGEAMKITRLFSDAFWAADLKWSPTTSVNKKWVVAWRTEVMAAYKALGEPNVGGDLGDPNAQIPGQIPWSMPK
jgi:hypothetical protein